MNLGNVNVPNEAEVAKLEAVKESVRIEMQAAAEGALAIERTQHTGQLRMAQRLAASHADQLLYVHGVGWLTWDGRRWTAADRGAPTRAVVEVLKNALSESLTDRELLRDVRKCESAPGIAGVLSIAAKLKPFAATVADIDADPYLLNVANGTLGLRTCELRPHDPADHITKVTNAAYAPDAPMGTWSSFVDQVLPDAEVREFVQRLAGVALLGVVVEHVLPIFTGTGANGKSTFDGSSRFRVKSGPVS